MKACQQQQRQAYAGGDGGGATSGESWAEAAATSSFGVLAACRLCILSSAREQLLEGRARAPPRARHLRAQAVAAGCSVLPECTSKREGQGRRTWGKKLGPLTHARTIGRQKQRFRLLVCTLPQATRPSCTGTSAAWAAAAAPAVRLGATAGCPPNLHFAMPLGAGTSRRFTTMQG